MWPTSESTAAEHGGAPAGGVEVEPGDPANGEDSGNDASAVAGTAVNERNCSTGGSGEQRG